MKREIKFRRAHFKDEAKTQFSHFSEWGVLLHPGIPFTSPSSNNFAMYFEDLQYTGLKDKNGKKIYEGDVIAFYDFFGGSFHVYAGEWMEEHEDMTGEIIFDRGDFCIQHSGQAVITDAIPLSQIISHVNFEVIGNIYENPKL